MTTELSELGAILGVAILGATVIATVLRLYTRAVRPYGAKDQVSSQAGCIFLFQGNVLVDATTDAWTLIRHRLKNQTEFDAMLSALAPEFASLSPSLKNAALDQDVIQSDTDPSVSTNVRRDGEQLRIALGSDDPAAYQRCLTRLLQASRDEQSLLLQDIAANSPELVWHENDVGDLLWANDTYTATIESLGITSLSRRIDTTGDNRKQQRISITSAKNDSKHAFDVSRVARADGFLYFASDATALVRADTARTELVRTLGKTFAELSTGLAIFDKNRRLAMFNPALGDMTRLPVDFLSMCPRIDTVLDRLREMRMMPEPKNYASWREQFTAVEHAAKNGTYSKNWALSDGQTLRVTGKPYPDGAFALLFDDISAEVSLARRFRLDIETGQAVLDTLSDAIAVFSSTGTLVMSNSAYAKLWACSPELALEHRVLQSEMKIWQDRCIPSAMWNDMRDYSQLLGARKPWADSALLDDGRHLQCHSNPIAGGMTMVRFVIASPARPEIRKLVQQDPAIQALKR